MTVDAPHETVPDVKPRHQALSPLLTPAELATYLGVPIATLYVWRHRRLGPPSFKAGRHLRYRLSDVEQWISNRVENVHDNSMGRG